MDKEEIWAIIKSYKDHRNIKQVINMRTLSNSEISKNFFFINLVATNKVKQLLQSLNAKATVGIKSIQHKLVKLVDICFFFNFLTEAIHCQLIEKSPFIIKLIKKCERETWSKFYSRCNFVKRSAKSLRLYCSWLADCKTRSALFHNWCISFSFFISKRTELRCSCQQH